MASLSCRSDANELSVSTASAAAAAAAAARQMSVDAEAIKIVIHDVDDQSPRRVSLRRDPNDKGHRCKSLCLFDQFHISYELNRQRVNFRKLPECHLGGGRY